MSLWRTPQELSKYLATITKKQNRSWWNSKIKIQLSWSRRRRRIRKSQRREWKLSLCPSTTRGCLTPGKWLATTIITVLSNLFPQENLIGGTKKDKNLSELISPTVQRSPGPTSEDRVDDDPDDEETRPTGRHNGSYHCDRFREKKKCEVCSHMKETSTIFSFHFRRNFAIHGRNIHLLASQKNKHRWFVYTIVDEFCELIYVGSTTDVCARWSQTKKACLDRNNSNTGLYKHFQQL